MKSQNEVDREQKFYELKKRELEVIFKEYDVDGNMHLDKEEIADMLYKENQRQDIPDS